MNRQKCFVCVGYGIVLLSVLFVQNMLGGDPRIANREAVTNDLANLALRAQDYYRRPLSRGGGQGSFVGITADAPGLAKLTTKATNSNGTYAITTAGSCCSITIRGVGSAKGTNGNPIDIEMKVMPDSTYVTYNN